MNKTEYHKQYYLSHKDLFKQNSKEYYKNNKEQIKQKSKKWYSENLDRGKETRRRYREKNVDKINEFFSRYRNTEHGKEIIRKTNKEYRKRVKEIVFNHYGNKCCVCGETQHEFLTIDHINNDGSSLRKNQGLGTRLYSWLIRNKFPEDYQILCWNHNCSKPYTEPKQSKTAIANRESYQKLKKDAIYHYGQKCSCCGESDIRYLTIDHPENNGAEHRKSMGTKVMYRWLKQNNYPEGYGVLCFNCNSGRSIAGGICPHKIKN